MNHEHLGPSSTSNPTPAQPLSRESLRARLQSYTWCKRAAEILIGSEDPSLLKDAAHLMDAEEKLRPILHNADGWRKVAADFFRDFALKAKAVAHSIRDASSEVAYPACNEYALAALELESDLPVDSVSIRPRLYFLQKMADFTGLTPEVRERCRRLVSARKLQMEPRIETPEPQPVPSPEAAEPQNVFMKSGVTWKVSYGGNDAFLPDLKGLADIHHLLEHPDKDFAAMEIMSIGKPTGGMGAGADIKVELGQPEALVDDHALKQIKEDLDSLDSDLDRAKKENDLGAIPDLEIKKASLLDYLKSTMKHDGRSRTVTSVSEKARKAVYSRVDDALKKIKEAGLTELFEHLASSLSTGLYCSYKPASRPSWTLS